MRVERVLGERGDLAYLSRHRAELRVQQVVTHSECESKVAVDGASRYVRAWEGEHVEDIEHAPLAVVRDPFALDCTTYHLVSGSEY